MDAREFFDTVKAQRTACKAESRDKYFKLSDLIDAEIVRVDRLMEDK